MRILIIEDEPFLRQHLADKLSQEGYAIDQAADGDEGLFMAEEYPLDLAIIDLGLPKKSGLEVIETLRAKQHSYPILILTARDRWQEKVTGLEAGADDYLTKPFEFEELLARTRALLRRAAGKSQSNIQAGPYTLNIDRQSLSMDSKSIDLTSYEYKVIEYLMLNHEKVISKTELTEHIYAQDYDRDSNVIEVFIKRLRKKLDPDKSIKPIETLRGRGYRFTIDPQRV